MSSIVPEPAEKVRFCRLAPLFVPMTLFVRLRFALRHEHNGAVSSFYALSGHLERCCVRSGSHDGLISCRLSPQGSRTLLGNRLSLDEGLSLKRTEHRLTKAYCPW